VIGVPMSRSTLAFKLAGNSRIPTLCVAASSIAMLGINTQFLGYIPKCVVGGLLLSLGLDLLYRWLVTSSRQLSRLEHLSLLLIMLIVVKWGFIAGILIGIIISCATFAFSVSQVSAIKYTFDGTEYRSTLDRSPEELALLARHGRELQGLNLQNYLFFGSANQIYQTVKGLLAERPECRFLVFDFRAVIGIDSSAIHSFTQVKQLVDKCEARLVLANLSPDLTAAFRAMHIVSSSTTIESSIDHALESCENAIIQAHRTDDGEAVSIRAWLTDALASAEYADRVVDQCTRLEVAPGDIVARQGDKADSMHFILEGRIGIIVNLDDGRSVRVRSVGRHTSIGEMGLITSRPRSATLKAEVASILYVLSADAFENIRTQDPLLGQALLTFVVKVMAERLSYTNRAIGLLQR
jgi:SulP family sulfate permease